MYKFLSLFKFYSIIIAAVLLTMLLATPAMAAKYVANEKQLELLNKLKGTNITHGELIETIFPEAIKKVPPKVKELMYKTPVDWSAEGKPSIEIKAYPSNKTSSDSISPTQQVLLVLGESNLSIGNPIEYDSGSRVWLPNPYFRIPYMAVESFLERQNYGYVHFCFNEDYDCYEISAGDRYYEPPSGYYRTQGVHWGEAPPGFNPPTYSGTSATGWKYKN